MESENPASPDLNAEVAHLRACISDLERALESMRRRTTLLEEIFAHLPIVLMVKDLEGRFVLISKYAASLINRTPEELIGAVEHDLLPPEIADAIRERDRKVIESGELMIGEDQVIIGNRMYVFSSIRFPIRNAEGRICAVGGIAIDITERKRAEEALRQQDQQLRLFKALVDRAPDGIAIADAQGVITYANPALEAMFGYQPTVVGRSAKELVVPDEIDQVNEVICQALEHGVTQGIIHYRRANGETFPAQFSALVLLDEQDQLLNFASINRDLTEHLRAQAEREALQRQIIEAQQAALRELSTPLLPISDDVLAMPIIGAIDSTRAQQIMDALLEGISRHHANWAIIDITGVQVVDTRVARALLDAAHAARLLGAQVILSGISPEIARTLVDIGADLGGVVTKSTLQQAIRFALTLPTHEDAEEQRHTHADRLHRSQHYASAPTR